MGGPSGPPNQMAKTKVRVLYPTAFMAVGIEDPGEEETVEESVAKDLIAQGWAEEIKAETKKASK